MRDLKKSVSSETGIFWYTTLHILLSLFSFAIYLYLWKASYKSCYTDAKQEEKQTYSLVKVSDFTSWGPLEINWDSVNLRHV